MAAATARFLPLKPLVFEILLALADSNRHGWSLVREVQQRFGADRILPGNFYRTLRRLRADGLIELAPGDRVERTDERRQYFQLTPLGTRVVTAEAERLKALLMDRRTRRLLRAR
jgi:DNA-binding PadR family transcriptional regulator